MQVEFIVLELLLDVFNYLPPGGITAIFPSSPTNLGHPQHATSLQLGINVWAHYQTSHGADGHWSQIVRCSVGVG